MSRVCLVNKKRLLLQQIEMLKYVKIVQIAVMLKTKKTIHKLCPQSVLKLSLVMF